MAFGTWQTEAVTGATSSEFDLGQDFRRVLVLIPTITSGTVTVHVTNAAGGTYFPLYALDDDATGDFASATTAATQTKAVVFDVGGAQYVKVVFGAAQVAETIWIRGCD